MHALAQAHDIDPAEIVQNKGAWNLPLTKKRDGTYKVPSGAMLHVCLTTDFCLSEIPDKWREHVWRIIARRPDVAFAILTKDAFRLAECLPGDWLDENGEPAYKNVELAVTAEDQVAADARIPYLIDIPAARRRVMCEPLLEEIDISSYLASGKIDRVLCGGENHAGARLCKEEWVRTLSAQCAAAGCDFDFFDIGENFVFADGTDTQGLNKKERHRLAKSLGLDVNARDAHAFELHAHPRDDVFAGESLFE